MPGLDRLAAPPVHARSHRPRAAPDLHARARHPARTRPASRSFYATFARHAEATHLDLFGRTVDDIEGFLLDQDVIYVGGGNTANMLAIWRLHGVDKALKSAWEEGVILAGWSAGANCWFDGVRDRLVRPEPGPAQGRPPVPAGELLPALRQRVAAAAALRGARRVRGAAGRLRRRRRRRAPVRGPRPRRGGRLAAGPARLPRRAAAGATRSRRRRSGRGSCAESKRGARRRPVPRSHRSESISRPRGAARAPRRRGTSRCGCSRTRSPGGSHA